MHHDEMIIEFAGRNVVIKVTTSSRLNKNRNLYINDYSRVLVRWDIK